MFFIKLLQDPPVLKSFVLREMQSPYFSFQLGLFVKGKVLPFLSQAEDGDADKTCGFVVVVGGRALRRKSKVRLISKQLGNPLTFSVSAFSACNLEGSV